MAVAGAQVVDDDDVVARLNELLHGVRADIAGASGDEQVHVRLT